MTELSRLLSRVRRRLMRAAVNEGITLAATALAVALIAGTIAASAKLSGASLALFELLIVVLALAFVVVRYGAVLMRSFRKDADVAIWIDRALAGRAPRDVVSFRSAVELSRDRGKFGESEALVDVALDGATARAKKIDPARLVASQVRPSIRRKASVLAGAALVLAALAVLMPAHFRAALGAASSIGDLENPLASLPPEPRLGDIRLSYRFPAYAQRPSLTVQSSSGEIRALPGTEVTIETNARHRLTEATLIVTHGEDESTRTAVEVDGRHLRATVIVGRSGRYRFRVRTEDGELLEERRGRAIELEPDLPPEVALLSPEVSPLEVNEQDRIQLEFSAGDDFALGDMRIAWRVLGSAREGRVPLNSASRGKKRHNDRGIFDLATLSLKPGDHVAYSIEALDSDTVNGPKVGASETKELRVYSKEAHHREVLSLAEKALDELVHILGDNLENAFAIRDDKAQYAELIATTGKILERGRAANKLLKETVEALKKDPLGQKPIAVAFESARRDLNKGVRNKGQAFDDARIHFDRVKTADERRAKVLGRRQDELVVDLEKNVVYLADLLNDQRMIDAEALTKQLREEQQNLRKALEEYRTAPTEERRRALEQAIREIKARIADISSELGKLRGSIPQDFVNPEAMEAESSLENMDRVQKMIEEGDLDGAMAELDRMLEDTEKMLSEMQQGRQELGTREYSEVTEQARQLWKNLEEIEQEQGSLGRRTEQHSRAMLEKMKDRLGDAKAFIEKQQRRLEQAQKAVERTEHSMHFGEGDAWDLALRRIEDTSKALEAQDFGAAREAVSHALAQVGQLELEAERRAEQARRFGDFFGSNDEAEAAAKDLGKARPLVEEVFKDIEKLMPDPDEMLSPEERQEIGKLSERQRGIKQRTQGLGEQLDRLAEQLPIVGEGTKELLEEAQGAMGDVERGLGSGDAPGALGDHQRAMDALGRLREALQKMGERGQGQGGSGVPLPFGPESAPGQEDQSGQGMEAFQDKVEIPKPEQYKAPAEFREDILKAAKQGTAEAYRDAVRRYYEEIVK